MPPHVIPVVKSTESAPQDGRTRRRSRQKRRDGRGQDLPEELWEKGEGRVVIGGIPGRKLAVWGGSLLLAAGLGVLWIRHSKPASAIQTAADTGAPAKVDPLRPPTTVRHSTPAEPHDPPAKDESGHNMKEFLATTRPLAKAFLDATQVDTLLGLVACPAEHADRIRGYYRDHPLHAAGMEEFGVDDLVGFQGGIAAVQVRTRDLEQKQMMLVDTKDGWKVDWESWVGWSEMSWKDFLREKPKTPKLFRVILRETQYYNYSFADERRWKSYNLTSPDGESSVIGYVERAGGIDREIRPAEISAREPYTLMLRFPPDADSVDQVIIDRMVSAGWVDSATPPRP